MGNRLRTHGWVNEFWQSGSKWIGRLQSSRSVSVSALAAEEGVGSTWVSRVIHLAFMAPDIVQCIARGEHPRELTAVRLMRLLPLPEDWSEQRALLGLR